MKKNIWLLCLTVLLVCCTAGIAFSQDSADTTIAELHIKISAPVCGLDTDGVSPQANAPGVSLEETDAAQQVGTNAWVVSYDPGSPSSYEPYIGTIEGDGKYTALVTIETLPGYCFGAETKVLLYDSETESYVDCAPVKRERGRLTIAAVKTAVHDWDWEQYEKTEPTCVSGGSEHYVCAADPSHTKTVELEPCPDAHVWGDWVVTREATTAENGERSHVCTLCGAVETELIQKITRAYSEVYEPDTSWPMAATIAWRADSGAMSVAASDVRPATAFVWPDPELRIYDRDGNLIADKIESYVAATSGTVIPAFYVNDSETAEALKDWLPVSGLLDCFVVSTPENRELVRDVADLLHVRGMLDFTSVTSPDSKALSNMAAAVNESHGKVILLSEETATRDNIRKLQSLTEAVWVQTSASDMKTLLTLYTNGVNGILTDDYESAVRAEEFFEDDVPSLLRVPLIIGHRGDPSTYVENTLDSAWGAFEEGVDAVENDIRLSADGELFILHDNSAHRLLGVDTQDENGNWARAENLTLEELRAYSYLWDDVVESNEVPASRSRYGTLYGQEEQREYTISTLREYIEAFRYSGMILDTEIKSSNPDILPAFKALVDEYDAWDQFFTITFNISILDAIYRDYPEISVGALGDGIWTEVKYDNYDEITANEGAEAALKALYDVIDQWNATYNPSLGSYGREMAQAGRHRGLTVWPWTYYANSTFAWDYMSGVSGMTLDCPWIASDFIVEISSEDTSAAAPANIPLPQGKTQQGEWKTLDDAELIEVEALSDTETLMMWRYRAHLTLDGTYYGDYYLYSNPFVFTEENSFGKDETAMPFNDVPADSFCADAVRWAYRKGVAAGTSLTNFSPDAFCTRAQAVTFLWRAMGEPEPDTMVNPFADVNIDDYYCRAVLWAVENGLTNGVDENHFGSEQTCTRAQTVTFLWRLHGCAEPDAGMKSFKDVPDGAYYHDAVLWAVDQGITNGTEKTAFSPDDTCRRSQIVTFLYRALAGRILSLHFGDFL